MLFRFEYVEIDNEDVRQMDEEKEREEEVVINQDSDTAISGVHQGESLVEEEAKQDVENKRKKNRRAPEIKDECIEALKPEDAADLLKQYGIHREGIPDEHKKAGTGTLLKSQVHVTFLE